MIIYYNKNGELKMISEKPIGTSLLDFIEKDLSDSELEKISDINWEKKIKNKKLVFTEGKEFKRKKNIIDKINKAKNMDELKQIIIDLI